MWVFLHGFINVTWQSSVGASEGLRRRRVNEESEEQEEADDDKGADSSKIGITSTGESI